MRKSILFCSGLLPLALLAGSIDDILPQGRMTLGANYWASPSATEMWRKWDAKAVDADLKTLADGGSACPLSGGLNATEPPPWGWYGRKGRS